MKAELKEFVDIVLNAMDRLEKRIGVRMDNFEARLIPLEQKVSNIEVIVTDIRDDLDAALAATDKHAVQLIDHRKRIGRLEKRIA